MISLRAVVITLLMLAFAGQGVASVSLSCQSTVAPDGIELVSHGEHSEHHGMDHHGSQPDAMDCCDSGYCSQAGCLTLSAAANAALPSPAQTVFNPPDAWGHQAAAGLPTSLDRPPILT